MKALVVGFGHVGQKISEIIFLEREKYPGLTTLNLSFSGIFTKTRGALSDPSGIDVLFALKEIRNEGKFNRNNPQLIHESLVQAIDNLEYDILVELSTLSIENKGEPAISYIRQALTQGKHVVTANKGPVAFAYKELAELAIQNNVHFLFESTVMDGTPVFNLAQYALKGATITGLSGILNSTTNYILSQMEKGQSFHDALRYAQSEGFAEANPQHDIEGWDGAAKIAALANVLMKANISPHDVDREGITGITPDKVKGSLRSGNRIKLICRAWWKNNQIYARVKPEMIPVKDPFAAIEGSGACLRIETDLMNPVLIIQDSPTIKDTAFGVLNNILAIQVNPFQ